jgi:hypothetical protein
MTLVQLEALRDKLRTAYYRGVLSIDDNGKHVTFASGEDVRRRLADVEAEIVALSGAAPSSRIRRAIPATRSV